MKPFNLEEALAGKPVVTRDGRPVKIAGYNISAKYTTQQLVGWVDGVLFCWRGDGMYTKVCSDSDLFMAYEKKEGWINIYPSSRSGAIRPSKEEADKTSHEDRVACIRIEWEE